MALFLAGNNMEAGTVPAELQDLTKVEEMLIARAFPIIYVYRDQGGQRGYKGHFLNLPQDVQGFSNSLPTNVSDLPILITRKQGSGKNKSRFVFVISFLHTSGNFRLVSINTFMADVLAVDLCVFNYLTQAQSCLSKHLDYFSCTNCFSINF